MYLKLAVRVIDCSAIAVLASANLCTSIGMMLDVAWVTKPGILGNVLFAISRFCMFLSVCFCFPVCAKIEKLMGQRDAVHYAQKSVLSLPEKLCWAGWSGSLVGIKPCACVSVSVCLCFFLKSRQELRLSIQSVDSAAPHLANENC